MLSFFIHLFPHLPFFPSLKSSFQLPDESLLDIEGFANLIPKPPSFKTKKAEPTRDEGFKIKYVLKSSIDTVITALLKLNHSEEGGIFYVSYNKCHI